MHATFLQAKEREEHKILEETLEYARSRAATVTSTPRKGSRADVRQQEDASAAKENMPTENADDSEAPNEQPATSEATE
jgi:hypothetical protein